MSKATWERYQHSEAYLRLKRLMLAYFMLMVFIVGIMIVSSLTGCSHPYKPTCTTEAQDIGLC